MSLCDLHVCCLFVFVRRLLLRVLKIVSWDVLVVQKIKVA